MDKETLKVQKLMVKDYWDNVDTIPVFINTTNRTHRDCREISREIFAELCLLFEPKSLSVKSIERLFDKVIEINSRILDIDGNLGLLYFGYVPDMLVHFQTQCEEGELYETAGNIKRYLEQYKKIRIDEE